MGSIRATVRAYSRVVSVNSAAITHGGLRLNNPDPGKRWNLRPRAPVYSCASVFWPTLLSRPVSRARWMASYLARSRPGPRGGAPEGGGGVGAGSGRAIPSLLGRNGPAG